MSGGSSFSSILLLLSNKKLIIVRVIRDKTTYAVIDNVYVLKNVLVNPHDLKYQKSSDINGNDRAIVANKKPP